MPRASFDPFAFYSSGQGRNFFDFRLQGMTKTTVYELTPAVVNFSFSETLDQAGMNGSVELYDPDKKLLQLGRGDRLRLLWREPVGKTDGSFKELYRWVIWDRTRTSRNQNTIQLNFYDMLIYLTTSEDFFLFQKDAKHKDGWTATEITQWCADRYKFPLGTIVKSKIKIPYIRSENSSIWDLLLKAWTYDRQHSNRKYILRAVNDKLYVFPKKQQQVMWEVADDTNIIDSSFTSSLEGMYTAVTVYGTSEQNKTGVPEIKVTVQHKQKVDKYGYIHKNINLDNVANQDTIRKLARNALLTTLRENLDGDVTAFGIPYLRAGSPISVKDRQSGIVGQFWIGDVRHDISSTGFTTNINLNWMDVVPSLEFDDGELHPPSSGYSGSATGSGVQIVIAAARSQKGVPYAWGGGNASGPTKGVGRGDENTVGFDCSGLMLYAYAQAGVTLPHYTDAQYAAGQKIPVGQEQPGDLVFYSTSDGTGGRFGHVAMWVGNGVVIQATRPVVKEGPRSGHTAVARFPQLARIAGNTNTGGSASSASWPGDSAAPARRAATLASAAANAGLPPELPVMAALAESSMKMSTVGDQGQAIGLFQIHPDRAVSDGFTADQRTDPSMQIQWFIQNATKHKATYASRGSSAYGAWIQAFENSANSSGSQYQAELAQARALLGISS